MAALIKCIRPGLRSSASSHGVNKNARIYDVSLSPPPPPPCGIYPSDTDCIPPRASHIYRRPGIINKLFLENTLSDLASGRATAPRCDRPLLPFFRYHFSLFLRYRDLCLWLWCVLRRARVTPPPLLIYATF